MIIEVDVSLLYRISKVRVLVLVMINVVLLCDLFSSLFVDQQNARVSENIFEIEFVRMSSA